MGHYARINEQKIVEEVIVANSEFINSGVVGEPSKWIQTSYNTLGGVHKLGGTPLRKNYAGIGYTYDAQRDAFIPPKPYASWVLNEDTCLWDPPTPYPDDGERYVWNESTTSWDLVEEE